jgi:DNA-3-methyladenine glycosylase II
METFQYGEEALCYLKKKDHRLAALIEQIGPIQRQIRPNLFNALIHAIIGQQISSKAQATVWARLENHFSNITPASMSTCPIETLQSFGMTFKKASYIQKAGQSIITKQLDLATLYHMTDEDVCRHLITLDGIGPWTAEMLLLFSMQRPDILSYGDLAIQRGLRMVYHHKKITPSLYQKYKRRYSPWGSVASLYLWEVASGHISGYRDYIQRGVK